MAGDRATVLDFGASGGMLAHPGLPPEPHDVLMAWSLEPTVLVALLLGACARRLVAAPTAGTGCVARPDRPSVGLGAACRHGLALASLVDPE